MATTELFWLNHLSLLPGDDSLTASHDAVTSGVGSGLAGLVVESSSTGEEAKNGGNKVVWAGIAAPPAHIVKAVRVCYELSDPRSFISQIRLAQVQDPPATATVLLDDASDFTDAGPVCVDSSSTTIDPALGPLLLDLRVNFGDTRDRIVIRGVGLRLEPKS